MHCITMHPVLVTSQKPDQNVDPKSPLSLSLKVFIPDICHFLHRQNFWRIKVTPKNANFCQFLPICTEICTENANFYQFLPIFRVKSVKIYTGQKNFTQTPSVASVTNIRYVFFHISHWYLSWNTEQLTNPSHKSQLSRAIN